MNHVLFIVGLNADQAGYESLMHGPSQYSIQNYWGSRLPKDHDLLVVQWNQASRGVDDLARMPENVAAIIAAAKARWGDEPVKVVGHSLGGWTATMVAALMGMPCWGLDPVDANHISVNTVGIPVAANVPYAKCWYRPPAMTKTPPLKIPNPIYSTFFAGGAGDPTRITNIPYSINDHGWPVYQAAVISDVAAYSFPIATPSPAPVPSMPVTLDSLAEVQANHERRIAAMEDKLKQQP